MHLIIKNGYDKKIPFANYALNFFLWYTNTSILFILHLWDKNIRKINKEEEQIKNINVLLTLLFQVDLARCLNICVYIRNDSKQ